MNRRMIAFVLGRVLLVSAALMVPSVAVGLYYHETAVHAFGPAILLSAVLGLLLSAKRPNNLTIYARDGFFIVASAWIIMSLVGAVPLYLCGGIASFTDCFFEIVSGFTTTGASVVPAIEELPRCILFWRSFSHWIGGMGVLVFVLAIIPLADDRSLHLMRAEVPGPVVGKLVPKMRATAKILYGTYSFLTIVLIVLLIAGGMPLFDSVCNAFGAAGTGGFAIRNAGIAYYDSAYADVVLGVFMLLFGVNFNLFYFILIGRAGAALKNEELHWYLGIVAVSTAAIAASILPLYKTVGESLRYAFFQVSSIITTTGFATADFANDWPEIAKAILVLLMCFGACAGSTGGGLKISRVIILGKTLKQEIQRTLHPRMVSQIRVDGKAVEKDVIHSVRVYFVLYMIIIVFSTLALSLDGFDFTTNLTAELACFNNIGPGLGRVGPMGNFKAYSAFSKLLLSFNMLLGRLEIYPLLVLFAPQSWRKNVN